MTTVACKLGKKLQSCPDPFKATLLHCEPLILDLCPRTPPPPLTQISIFYLLTYRVVEGSPWLWIYAQQIQFQPLKHHFLFCTLFSKLSRLQRVWRRVGKG